MLLGVDVGGTFTDAALVGADGRVWTAKTPSTPRSEQEGVLAAVEAVLARANAEAGAVERFAHGMTVATNALLESDARPPARVALVTTEGFEDVVELARQARPSLYRLCEAGPRPLAERGLRFGAPERMGPDGVVRSLDTQAARAMVERLARCEPEAVAVVLLHSYADPEHERVLGALIRERLREAHVCVSHELVGTFREYERAATTELDAALSPLLGRYLGELSACAADRGLPAVRVMQSSGGLTDARRAGAHAALTVLSGPAGGVGGARALCAAAGVEDALCFDMGGTSCDVCVIDGGRVAETAERTVAGRPLALAALDIHTVGAGGGSVAWRDAGGALRVGPQSAGADPGPAAYGRGGERATVTDANVVLGRLPEGVGLAGGVALDHGAAERAVGALARELGIELLACAEGIVRVAETEMRRALAGVTVERGIDPRRFALMSFGGAGPLHAAAMADGLGIERVLCARASGVLSALGLAASAGRCDASGTVMLAGAAWTAERTAQEVERLAERAAGELGERPVRARVRYELRYRGQSFELGVDEELDALGLFGSHPRSVPAGHTVGRGASGPAAGRVARPGAGNDDPARLRERFERAHERRYGYRDGDADVELVNVRVSVWGAAPVLRLAVADEPEPERTRTRVAWEGEWVDSELWHGAPPPGVRVDGPAVCALEDSTLLVPRGWRGTVDECGTIALERTCSTAGSRYPITGRASDDAAEPGATVARLGGVQASETLDPIELQVIVGALRAACEEMGATLVRAAHSPNIKERRDSSTALFDARGQLAMQAAHIPVHLGSMGAAVEAVLDRGHREGVSWVLNDPLAGGTHLPDITVITPVFAGRSQHPPPPHASSPSAVGSSGVTGAHPLPSGPRAPIGFAVSRAHHADVGGRVPGSMPADSGTLAEEGVVISPQPLTDGAIEELTARMRGPRERRADLRAQLAANAVGARRLAELAGRVGVERLATAIDSVQDYAERRMRACVAALGDTLKGTGGVREARDVLEGRGGDLQLRLRATVADDLLTLDFSGSAGRDAGNLNCPLAVTRAACWFAVLVLSDPDIPPCAGAYRPIEVIAEPGSLLNAGTPEGAGGEAPAVAGGNVETSSRVADLVLAAFGRALGQGTMNNVTLGDERFAYYETIGGGQGACADADGPSAVHVAMSNTLNTPVEALERELPLRVSRYEVRRGSGGAGARRGGDGVVRELEALREMSFSLIGDRRRHPPPGAHGGGPGASGRDTLIGVDGGTTRLQGKTMGTLRAGERLRIETPGGGGYGEPADELRAR